MTSHNPDEDADFISLGNLYIAGVVRAVQAMDEGHFKKLVEVYEHWSAGSVVLLATGMSMGQFDAMEEKRQTLRALEKFREEIKQL